MDKHTFKAVIEGAGGGGAFVRVPFDVEQAFGSKRPRIKATIEGETYRGTLVRMRTECHILGILKEIRQKTGKGIGDQVSVVVEPDGEARAVEIPAELAQALRKVPRARAAFEESSYTFQKEAARSIMDAKKPETRQRRIAQLLEQLTSRT